MSIDLSDINNAHELVVQLGLINKTTVEKFSYEQLISDVWEFSNKIWKDTKDTSFTDHGIQHSLRIIEYFLDFDNLFEWDPFSKFIFSISALIHDIGMQYKYWIEDDIENISIKGEKIFPKFEDISDEEIRDRHCELGFKLIYHQIFNEDNIEFMWNICKDTRYKDCLFQAMYIAFSHSSKSKYFDSLKEDNETWKKYANKKTGYSPRLLACILRLCDEFDCSIKRIIPERLRASELTDYSVGQWLTCYYINELNLYTFKNSQINPYIDILWQSPPNLKKIETNIIKDFILSNRIVKIHSEIDIVKKFLFDTKEEGLSKIINLDSIILSDIPKPNALLKFGKDEKSIILRYTYKNDNQNGEYQEENKYINAFKEDSLNDDLSDDLNNIKNRLEEWFYKSIDPKHYVLETTDHTNIFLNCRTLFSDQSLLRDMAKFIHNYFCFAKIKIDCVLAIGTSAIPIAVNYQIFSNCRSTFTMSKKKALGSETYREDYISTELIPIISDSKNILIIDDIISIGDVTKKIVEEYLSNDEIENIYQMSLFRLGSREIKGTDRIKKYKWLCHIPWVYYWRGDGNNCDYCKEGIEIVYEHKM